jgi:hypothetical protein
MQDHNLFDVLVVYTNGIATSAANTLDSSTKPFSHASGRLNYNHAYAYFLETCRHLGLSAAFSTVDSIIEAGTCKSYWEYHSKSWHKKRRKCYSNQIFEKFSPINPDMINKRKLLFSSDKVQPFNDHHLASLFFDKCKTYRKFAGFTIPTVAIKNANPNNIRQSLKTLRQLIKAQPYPNDFGQQIILKDRYGAGGINIYLVTEKYIDQIQRILDAQPRVSFIIQPLVKFERGYSYQGKTAATDIRLIYQYGKIIQTYVRIAKAGDFRCNEHQGGELIYVTLEDIPKQVIAAGEKIAAKLCKRSLYALDFVVTDLGNVYLLEGNIGPGIDWNLALKKNEYMSKALIQAIVEEFVIRVNLTPKIDSITSNQDYPKPLPAWTLDSFSPKAQ